LIYAVEDAAAAVYHDELMQRDRDLPRLTVKEHFSEEEGFIDQAYLENLLESPLTDFLFMMCGPPPMIEALYSLLVSAGVRHRQILIEDFDLR
jgi:ferredoxin-NADP reductase